MDENLITSRIIGCAIEVHKNPGSGLLEGVYEECLFTELQNSGLTVSRQLEIPISYKKNLLSSTYRVDLMVENQVIVEVKAVDLIKEIYKVFL